MDNNKYYLSCGILPKWFDKTFKDFTNEDAMPIKEFVLQYLSNVKDYKKEGVGLYLWGANGVGKSLLLNCAFKELINKGYKVRIVSFSELITNFANGWYDKTQQEVMSDLKNCDFLGIEEVGKEFQSKESSLAKTVLDNIYRYRLQHLKPTWITSNANAQPKNIKVLYSEDIASMMKEGCIDLQVKGNDYREVIRKKIKTL